MPTISITIPQIPAILTDKDWQKKKGILAKAQGETGVGELMKKLAQSHIAVDWTKFKVANPLSITREALAAAEKTARGQFAAINKYHDAALALMRQADKTAAEWKKSKTVPSSSRNHVENVSAAALNYATAIKSWAWDVEFKYALTVITETEKTLKEILGKAVAEIRTAIASISKELTADAFDTKVRQKLRALAAAIGRAPALKGSDYEKAVTTMTADSFMQGATTPDEVEKRLDQVKKFLVAFENRK